MVVDLNGGKVSKMTGLLNIRRAAANFKVELGSDFRLLDLCPPPSFSPPRLPESRQQVPSKGLCEERSAQKSYDSHIAVDS